MTSTTAGSSPRDRAAEQRLHDALQPAVARVAQALAQARHVCGRDAALRATPKLAAVLALLTLTAHLALDLPAWLPALLALTGAAAAYGLGRRALPAPHASLRDGALACDRAHHNHDRLSAACELSSAPAGAPSLGEALARAAIDDGVSSLARIDAARLALVPTPARVPLWPSALAVATLLALPWLLPARGDDQPTGRGDGASARAAAAPARNPDPAAAANPPAVEPPALPRAASDSERRDDRAKAGSPPPPPKAEPAPAVPAASGQGQTGSDAAGDSTQTGAPKAAPAGKAGSGQSGGGAGASASGAPEPQQDQQHNKATPKPKAQKPQKDTPQQDGKPSESAGAPSGPSRGSGRMAAVGNKRNDLNRGLEREDEPEVEDEPIEDESDEQEQRGGVMPMRRGDNRPAARELSISGDGPPDQGRGGPTPPKKSRGTASLVLGLRLPDSVRGQPNPGTAKTSLEQIPPRPSAADAGLARAAGTGRPATPQSARQPGALVTLLQAYHDHLARQELADKNPKTEPSR